VPDLKAEHFKIIGGVNTANNVSLDDVSVKELALRTQGFTACDILKLMRDQLQQSQIHNTSASATINSTTTSTTIANTTITLSLRILLQAISNTTPSGGGTTSAEAHRFVRQIDTIAPTALVGMQAIQKQLLKCIGTVVPELRDAESVGVGGSVRKCSGTCKWCVSSVISAVADP